MIGPSAESTVILIPVKGFRAAKQRLAAVLTAEERLELARTMLEDVLGALADCVNCPPVNVITSDSEVQKVAARFGCGVISDGGATSETEAVAVATQACVDRSATGILVVPGDIPLVEAGEVRAVLEALPEHSKAPAAVLVPARDGRGTNAALLRPPGLIDLRFGNDSFEPHLRAVKEKSQFVNVLRFPGIGLDIDNPADLAALLGVQSRTASQKLLRSWKMPERLQAGADEERAQVRRMTP